MNRIIIRSASAILALGLAGSSLNSADLSGKIYAEPDTSAESADTAAENIRTVDPKRLRRGTEKVFIDSEEIVTATNGMFTLYYESDRVSVVSVKCCDGFGNMMTAVGTKEPGKIVVGFMSASPVELSGTLLEVECEFETGYEGKLIEAIQIDEFETENANGEIAELDPDCISASQITPTLGVGCMSEYNETDGNGYTDDRENLSVELKLFNEGSITNGVFSFEYDHEMMTYSGYAAGEKFEDYLIEVNETEPGKLAIAVAGTEPVSVDDDLLLMTLDFIPVKNGSTRIAFSAEELSCCGADNVITEYNEISSYGIDAEFEINISAQTPTASPEPTEQPTETAPASPVPTVQPTETTPASPEPTVQPTETTPASPVPTVQPTETESFDVDGDGVVNTLDLLKLIKIIIDPTAAKPVTADLTGDGKINAEDVTLLRKTLMQ